MARIKDVDAPAVSLVIVLVMDMAVAVRPGLWLKACADLMHVTAKPFNHGLQHMVGQQPQKPVAHLQWHMPIADVIRDASQRRRIVCMHFQQCFRRSLYRHHPTIREQQAIFMADQRAHRQVDADVLASQQGGTKPRTLPEFEGQFKHCVSRAVASGEGMGHGHRHRCGLQNQNRK